MVAMNLSEYLLFRKARMTAMTPRAQVMISIGTKVSLYVCKVLKKSSIKVILGSQLDMLEVFLSLRLFFEQTCDYYMRALHLASLVSQ